MENKTTEGKEVSRVTVKFADPNDGLGQEETPYETAARLQRERFEKVGRTISVESKKKKS